MKARMGWILSDDGLTMGHSLRSSGHWLILALLLCLTPGICAVANADDLYDEVILDPSHEDYAPPAPASDVIIEFPGDAGIFETGKPGNNLRRRIRPIEKGTTCGQGNDCAFQTGDDVVFAVQLPTSRYWSFSLCGSAFDTYLAIGTTPCSADLGFNDDYCGEQSRTECLFLDAGTVYIAIGSASGDCGTYRFRVDTCSPGRCCYTDANNEPACMNTGLEDCAIIHGEWDATKRCETDPCPVGRCCYADAGITYCVDGSLEKNCLFNFQGEWTEGATCDDVCETIVDSSSCGPIDLVLMIDISGSMAEEIASVRQGAEEILEAAVRVAGSDLRASTVGFREYVQVFSPLTGDIGAVAATFGQMSAAGGSSPGEASDEALREVITQDGGECVVGTGFAIPFRENASKVVVLVTDELNSGCNHIFSPAYAHQRALDAAAAGIHISPIYITGSINNPDIAGVLQDYATTTHGLYVRSPRGEDIADKIETIIKQCGQPGLAFAPSVAPEVTCEDGISPTTFDVTLRVYNQADITIGNGAIALASPESPGGAGFILSESPQFVGLVEPQDTVDVPFTVSIEPGAGGGCINFEAYLLAEDDTISAQTVCIDIPVVSLTLGAHSVPAITCVESGMSPTTFEVSFVVRNPSECGTSAGYVALSHGSGQGGTGTVLSAQLISTGLIDAGDSTIVQFLVSIAPRSQGGCISFPAHLIFLGDTLGSRTVCVNIPRSDLDFVTHVVPPLNCADGVISPTTFDLEFMVRNSSDCATDAGLIALREGSGPGGTGVVVSENPRPLGLMLPGDSVIVRQTVSITPTSWGGCITFTAYLALETDTVAARLVCVTVPQVQLLITDHDAPALRCSEGGVLPTNIEIGLTITNPSGCSTSLGALYLMNGSGPGGAGTVVSENPVSLEQIAPGDTIGAGFTVNVSPSALGGCVTFRAKLILNGDTVDTEDICVSVPVYGGQLVSSATGELWCDGETLLSTETGLTVVTENLSECTIPGGMLCLSSGSGPGGNGVVVSSDSVEIGELAPGEGIESPFTIAVSPIARGGHITFTAALVVDADTVSLRNISVGIPACGCESSSPVQRIFTGQYHECFCVYLCDTLPVPISFCRTSGAPGFRPALIESGTCGSDCAEGEALVIYGDWTRVGSCWTNVIHPVYQGCVRLCVDIYLPVDLTSFEVTPGFDRIDLRWTTASESEIDHYEILKNGALLSEIPAANLATGSDYAYTDQDVREGHSYRYQLVSIDFGGERTELEEVTSAPLRSPQVISEYSLLPNYPNPFNGSTTIEFDVPDATEVLLTVYDVAGRKVRELVRGHYSAGRHAVVFGGEELASGLYFCHMIAGEFSTRQKMLLLK